MGPTDSLVRRVSTPRATPFRLSALCRAPALFLQPQHGATLACGGAAALIAQAGWPSIVVSVFAAVDLHRRSSSWAQQFGERTYDPESVVTLRRAEEACAAAVLG
ncbi:MAG: hypothetical protein EOO24_58340, partial [Comamonadaceae bacterium]